MTYKKFACTVLCFSVTVLGTCLEAEPPRKVPEELVDAFTISGKIPLSYQYSNDTSSVTIPPVYTEAQISLNMQYLVGRKIQLYYGATDLHLHAAMEKYASYIKGKKVAVIGSVLPWYESYVLHYGGMPTTIEYNKIISTDPRLEILTVDEYEKNPVTFDAVLSISSIEHDGLGRYGDPIDPCGDFKAMEKTRAMLKKDGLLFLAVPIGTDRLVWNLHRIYGRIRLPLLLNGWEIIDSFGYCEKDLDRACGDDASHQPIFVLRSLR